MGVWMHYELGNYRKARELAIEYEPKIADCGFAAGESHARAWIAVDLWRLGDWDGSLNEFGKVIDLLGDRRDEPPYFVVHSYAVAGIIHEARGQRLEADKLVSLLTRLQERGETSSRIGPWFGRLLVMRGDLELARKVLDTKPPAWRVHASDFWEAEADLVAAAEQWNRADGIASDMRAHEEQSGSAVMSPFADLLQGRAAAATGNTAQALERITRASEALGDFGARWEKALADLDLAGVLGATDRSNEAHDRLKHAISTLESLRDERGLTKARRVAESL
jgi:tetratricopeptide (TPR) repeat protein